MHKWKGATCSQEHALRRAFLDVILPSHWRHVVNTLETRVILFRLPVEIEWEGVQTES